MVPPPVLALRSFVLLGKRWEPRLDCLGVHPETAVPGAALRVLRDVAVKGRDRTCPKHTLMLGKGGEVENPGVRRSELPSGGL